jgi:hypothetical protein
VVTPSYTFHGYNEEFPRAIAIMTLIRNYQPVRRLHTVNKYLYYLFLISAQYCNIQLTSIQDNFTEIWLKKSYTMDNISKPNIFCYFKIQLKIIFKSAVTWV